VDRLLVTAVSMYGTQSFLEANIFSASPEFPALKKILQYITVLAIATCFKCICTEIKVMFFKGREPFRSNNLKKTQL
jgi:hypothetical protein